MNYDPGMLRGVFPPLVTPFAEEKIDFAGLRRTIERLNGTKIRGYMPLGSNGEFRSLTEDESLRILALVAAVRAPDKTVMAGAGRESAWATIEFMKKVADTGADCASVITPHYYARHMTDEALVRYFTRVADHAPIPILVYNVPEFAGGVRVSPSVVARLAEHPRIVGMKDSSKEDIALYAAANRSRPDFSVLSGSINKFLYGLRSGACGGVLSMANYLPEHCCLLEDLHREGRNAEADELSARLVRLNAKISGKYGVAGVKVAMDLSGYSGGAPRLPLLPPGGEEREEIRIALAEEGFDAPP